MKKFLSFVLVVAMMIPMIIMPTSATASNEEWNWEGMFEELDIRNVGMPKFNVGAAESTGVVVDGKIDTNDNYTEEKVLNNGYLISGTNKEPTQAAPDITVRMARKGAYFYVSFQMKESTANHNSSKIQLGMSVSNGPTTADSICRAETWLTSTTANYKSISLFGPNWNRNNDGTAPGYTGNYIVDYAKTWVQDTTDNTFGISTYEAKVDLEILSLMTSSTKTKAPDTEGKMLQMMFYYYENGSSYQRYFWYTINNAGNWGVEDNPYKEEYATGAAFFTALQSANGHSGGGSAGTEGVALPIAFGGATVPFTHTHAQESVGEVGTDVRNVEEGHLINIPTIADVAPVVDGVIGENEYTVKNKKFEFKTSSEESYVTVNLAYKDGYIYIGAVTTEAAATNTQLDMNAMPVGSNYAGVTVNRTTNPVKANADLPTTSGSLVKAGGGTWASTAQTNVMLGDDYLAEGSFIFTVDTANKSNGVDQTVYEYKISAALLAEYWGAIYNVPNGISIFGLQIWTHGVSKQNAMNDTGAKKRAAISSIDTWGLDWGLYTIQTPEATDAYLAAHKAAHQKKLNMINGGSARVSAEATKSGLRFKSTFTAEYIAEITTAAAGQEITVGTLIAPADYVAAAGAFTMEALDAKYGAGKGYVKVIADLENGYAVDENGNVTIAGSITNIKDKNIDRDFAAVAFVQYGDTVLYAKNRVVRNVYEIVAAAATDTANYTEEELELINAQLARYNEILAG